MAHPFFNLLFLTIFILFFGCKSKNSTSQSGYYLISGSYTTSQENIGINLFFYDSLHLKLQKISLDGDTIIENPSFMAFHPNLPILYAVEENLSGKINVIHLEKKTNLSNLERVKLTKTQTVSTYGEHPCYIEISPDNKNIAVANYSSGNVCIYNLKQDGSIDTQSVQTLNFIGNSINKIRQEKSHCHAIKFNATLSQIFIADLGLDKIFIKDYKLSPKWTINNLPLDSIQLIPGSGPRHFCWTKDNQFLFVAEELSGCLSVYKNLKRNWKLLNRISLHKDTSNIDRTTADIHLSADERFVYISNRGWENNMAIVEFRRQTEIIQLLNLVSSEGNSPRNFLLSNESDCWVANQLSNNLCLFKINKDNGNLSITQISYYISRPVFINKYFFPKP